jgi:competence protein ComEC
MLLSPRIIAGYPAIRYCIAISAGIVLLYTHPLSTGTLLRIALVLLPLVALLCVVSRPLPVLLPLRDGSLLALLVFSGMCVTSAQLERLPRTLLAFSDTPIKAIVHGVVVSAPRSTASGQSFILRCDTLHHEQRVITSREELMVYYARSAWVTGDTLTALRPGDRIMATGRLRSPRPARNPHAFDARERLLHQGMTVTLSISRGSDLSIHGYENPGMIPRSLFTIRTWLGERIHQTFAQRHVPLFRGLLLGDRGDIDRHVLDDFRASGIMHILAVSGLHAGIIVTLVLIPLERTRFGFRGLLAMIAVWCFAGITGFAPPVMRAAMMTTMFILARMAQRSNTSVNALAAAGVIILLSDPLALFSLSFQLSFGAVFGILLFHARIKKTLLRLFPVGLRKGPVEAVVSLLALTASAQSFTAPLLVSTFGEFSLVGFAVNLVAVPLVFVVVTCGLLAVLVGTFWNWPGAMVAITAAEALDLILKISEWSSSLPWAVLHIPELGLWQVLIYVLAVLILAHREGRLWQKATMVSLIVCAALSIGNAIHSKEAYARITFLDVGQGDAVLIELPGECHILIDTGPSSPVSNSGESVILPQLRRRGIETLDILLLTHPDNDHIGGAASVVNAVPIKKVILACDWPERGEARELLRTMQRKNVLVHDAREGDIAVLSPDARLYILAPPGRLECTASNEQSVVAMLLYGSTKWLFTGDADIQTEIRLAVSYDSLLRADVLKVGHHGSTTSSDEFFLHTVRPDHSVICAGRLNHFRHPRPEVLRRLTDVGSSVHRTDISGAIQFESDGSHIWLR